MKKIFKLHQEFLFEFINLFFVCYRDKQLKIKLFAMLFKNYYKFLKLTLNESCNYYFSSTYRQKIKLAEKQKKVIKRMQEAFKALQWIDAELDRLKLPRYARKQFWNDFKKRGEIRKDIFEKLVERFKKK